MKVGDLVKIKHSDYSPFYLRPDVGEVGIIVEINHSSFMGVIYFVQTSDGIWRFSDYEVELLNGSG
tara:strand:- start:3080 stop:3277 length:198 start_codon:yes stop_codon:yes gene_type:complete